MDDEDEYWEDDEYVDFDHGVIDIVEEYEEEDDIEYIESELLDHTGRPIIYAVQTERKPLYCGFLAYDEDGNLVPRHKLFA